MRNMAFEALRRSAGVAQAFETGGIGSNPIIKKMRIMGIIFGDHDS